jgi:hypothetical protein
MSLIELEAAPYTLLLAETAPPDGCISFQTLYQALAALAADLHQHIHLENNILFPRAVEMEEDSAPELHKSAVALKSGSKPHTKTHLVFSLPPDPMS